MTICMHTPALRTKDYLCALCVIDELRDEVKSLERYRDNSPLGVHLLKEQIAKLNNDLTACQLEREALRRDISEAYNLRDAAEGRYCTALVELDDLRRLLRTVEPFMRHTDLGMAVRDAIGSEPQKENLK